MLRRQVLASAAYRFSILKGRFCFLFQLMDRHISILKTVCRPCGKRLSSKSGYSGVWTPSVEMVASYRLFKSSVTTFSLIRARRYLLPWKWKIEVRHIFCDQKENIAVVLSKFASDPSKQKSYASWFNSYARPLHRFINRDQAPWPVNEELLLLLLRLIDFVFLSSFFLLFSWR